MGERRLALETIAQMQKGRQHPVLQVPAKRSLDEPEATAAKPHLDLPVINGIPVLASGPVSPRIRVRAGVRVFKLHDLNLSKVMNSGGGA